MLSKPAIAVMAIGGSTSVGTSAFAISKSMETSKLEEENKKLEETVKEGKVKLEKFRDRVGNIDKKFNEAFRLAFSECKDNPSNCIAEKDLPRRQGSKLDANKYGHASTKKQ